MSIKTFFAVFIGWIVSATAARAENNSPLVFYKSLLSNIDQCSGRMVLYLNNGYYTVRSGGLVFLINVDEGVAINKVSVTFDYYNGKLQKTTLLFQPALHVALISPRQSCSSIRINSITYDGDGDEASHDAQWDAAGCSSPNVTQIFRLLSINSTFADLGNGKLFQNSTGFKRSNKDGVIQPVNTPLVYKISFLPGDNGGKALEVTLRDGGTLFLTRDQNASDFAMVGAPSKILLKRLVYDMNAGSIDGELDSLVLNVQKASLKSEGFYLNIGANSTLRLKYILFRRSTDESYVDAETGVAHFTLGDNTYLGLYQGRKMNEIYFNDGSQADFVGLRYVMNDLENNGRSTLHFDEGTHFVIRVKKSTFSVGNDGYVNIENSDLDANIGCTYTPGQKPLITGLLKDVDLHVTSGEVKFNPDMNIRIKDGNLVARTALHLNSTESPFITGIIDRFDITLREDSKFNIPRGFMVNSKADGKLVMADPLAPLRLDVGKSFPYGAMDVDMTFSTYLNGADQAFSITDGALKGTFEHKGDGTITGKDMFIKGAMLFKPPAAFQISTLSVGVVLADGTLTKEVGKDPNVTAYLSATIDPGGAYRYVTPRMTPDDRTILFPLKLDLSLAAPIVINRVKITFTGNKPNINLDQPVAVNLYVPDGEGEHDIDHGDRTGDGPDDYMHYQEVCRYDVKDPGGVAHIYLFNRLNYQFDAQLTFAYGSQGLDFSVTDFRPRQAILWDRDGGKGFIPILLSLVAGAIVPGLAIPVFVAANVVADDLADHVINTMLYSFIAGFKLSPKTHL